MRKITLLTLIIMAGFLSREGLFAAEAKKPSLPVLPMKSAPVKQPVPAPQPLLPSVLIPESTYSYNPVGKADPFRPFVDVETTVKKKEEKKSVSSIFPLQREEVDKFKVVGIAGDQTRRIAVVEDAAKKYYPLFIGTHIGPNNGKVVEILPDRVIIEERETKKGKRIILKLHKN
jgi:type IV pilus assembly protein PilP